MYQEQESFQEQQRARFLKRRAEEAVSLAMDSRWEEAAQANRDIIAMLPHDHHAYNRLGKGLTELGRYAEARAAYSRALELDSTNTIAKKNVARLAALGEEGPAEGPVQKLAPHLFIAETGRTGSTELLNVDTNVVIRLTPGDQVELRRQEAGLAIHTVRGERIGEIEPRMGLRLASLMAGGNMYAAAIVSVDGEQCRIIIREVYQDPSQEGRPSFPATGAATDAFRPYTKERLVRAKEGAIAGEFEDETEEWDDDTETSHADAEAQEGDTPLPDEDDDSDEEPDEE